ncbi:hypothetical protein SAMN05216249_1228 [Acetitomaculum ruminis DSM 5522]|uniref:Multimeric flavodoxin WrbA n=1 Tax=Acetitomaculum ruminis DSM 5522 TaxID=1120918 RepID=A0A1I1A7W5_9FIRM|nr:hypothetical protein [Acetitomaculum ruminis]SFB33622.1 hypothetical protein SAMN05216249_1228 [Acetitomaculum ruminis DSM 5522]
MHVMIVNGSPRVENLSNTEKIIDAFVTGLSECDATYERYAISKRSSWKKIKEAYMKNTEIIFALPLYAENIPGIMLEFLETLPAKDSNTRLSFILQGGFGEASQLDCGLRFLRNLPKYLGVSYGGTLVKGDNFGIRVVKEEIIKFIIPYVEQGRAFVRENGFKSKRIKKFAGPKYYALPVRIIYQFIFMTYAKKRFAKLAKEWGSSVPIDYKPWE